MSVKQSNAGTVIDCGSTVKKPSFTRSMRKQWRRQCGMLFVAHDSLRNLILNNMYNDYDYFSEYKDFCQSLPVRDPLDRRIVETIVKHLYLDASEKDVPDSVIARWPMAFATISVSEEDLSSWAFRHAIIEPDLFGDVADQDENLRAFQAYADLLFDQVLRASLVPPNLDLQ